MAIEHTTADVNILQMQFQITMDIDRNTATGTLTVQFKSKLFPPSMPPLTMQVAFSDPAQLAAIFTPARITALRDLALQKAIDLLNQKTGDVGPTLA